MMLTNRRHLLQIGVLIGMLLPAVSADTFREGGDAYRKGDFVTAAAKFLEVAEKGDHRAMYALGSMYAAGDGVPRDYQQAFSWFSKAAQYGRVDAQYKLGLMYDEGIGVKQNYRRAIRLYDAAARKAYAHAQFRMGLLYAKGNGVRQDNIKAYAWLRTAASNYAAERERQQDDAAIVETEGSAGEPVDIFNDMHTQIIDKELEEIAAELDPEERRRGEELALEYLKYR